MSAVLEHGLELVVVVIVITHRVRIGRGDVALCRRGERFRRQPPDGDSPDEAAPPPADVITMTFRGGGGGAASEAPAAATDDAPRRVVRVSLMELRRKAGTYRQAARVWAARARTLARTLGGEDSPSYAVYERALRCCWRGEDEPVESGAVAFSKLWVEAGLST